MPPPREERAAAAKVQPDQLAVPETGTARKRAGLAFPVLADMTLGRIGGGFILLSCAAFVYTSANGLDLIAPATLLGIGAAVVAVAGPRPLDARLTRVGLGILAVGAMSNTVFTVIEKNSQSAPQEGLVLFLISLAAIPVGYLVTGLSLARSSGPPRAVGATLLLGLLLVIIGEAVGGGLASPPPMLLIGLAVAILGLTGVGALALGICRFQQRDSG